MNAQPLCELADLDLCKMGVGHLEKVPYRSVSHGLDNAFPVIRFVVSPDLKILPAFEVMPSCDLPQALFIVDEQRLSYPSPTPLWQ